MTRLGNCRLGAILLRLIFPIWCRWKIFYLRMEIVINFPSLERLPRKPCLWKHFQKANPQWSFFFLLVLAANLQHLCYDSDFVQILNKSLSYLWFKRFISFFFFFCTQNFLLLILNQYLNNSSLKFCCWLVYCDKFNNFPGVFHLQRSVSLYFNQFV